MEIVQSDVAYAATYNELHARVEARKAVGRHLEGADLDRISDLLFFLHELGARAAPCSPLVSVLMLCFSFVILFT